MRLPDFLGTVLLVLTMVPFVAVPAALLRFGDSREEVRAWFWLLQLLLFAYTFGIILILQGLSGVLFPLLFVFSLIFSIIFSCNRRKRIELRSSPWSRGAAPSKGNLAGK